MMKIVGICTTFVMRCLVFDYLSANFFPALILVFTWIHIIVGILHDVVPVPFLIKALYKNCSKVITDVMLTLCRLIFY